MSELLLGLRLLLGSGRGSRARFLLMVAGSAIGVCCLAVVLAIPEILTAQDARKAARDPDCSNGGGVCYSSKGDGRALTRMDPYGSEPLLGSSWRPGEKASIRRQVSRAFPDPEKFSFLQACMSSSRKMQALSSFYRAVRLA